MVNLPGYDLQAFKARVAPCAEHLRGLLAIGETIHEWTPPEDGVLARERKRQSKYAGEWGETPADDAITTLHLLMAAAEGHMWSICELLGSPKSGPATFGALARAALEAMARAVWIGDAALGLEERIRRSKNELLYSLREQEALGWNESDAREREGRILRTADDVGIGTIPSSKKGPRRYVIDPLRRDSSLI